MNTATIGRSLSCDSQYLEIPGLKATYTSADEKRCIVPDEVMMAISACRVLDADFVAFEFSDRTIVVAINAYDDTYAAATCDKDIVLPAVARCLQVLLLDLSVPEIRPDILPATIMRKSIGRWERRIAVIFGGQYAARLVTAMSPAKSPDSVTIEDMEVMRRKLLSALGDCIDLPEVDTG